MSLDRNIKTEVFWNRRVEKAFKKLPKFILRRFYSWVTDVRYTGIRAVRRLPGYHDEPLTGSRLGQRSVRLNLNWRVFYVEVPNQDVELIEIIEVNKHEY